MFVVGKKSVFWWPDGFGKPAFGTRVITRLTQSSSVEHVLYLSQASRSCGVWSPYCDEAKLTALAVTLS